MCPVCQSCVNCRWCCETPCVQCDIVSTVCSPYCCVDSTGLTAALGVCYGEITLQVYMTSTGHRLSSRLYFSILYRFKVYLINLFPHIAPVFEVFHATFRPPAPRLLRLYSTRKHNRCCCFLADLRRSQISSVTLAPSQHQGKVAYCEDQRC